MPISLSRPVITRIAELDGLRALAVISVIAFHCDIGGMFEGGFYGVDVFFTISGFLITRILIKEMNDTGTIGFLPFYFKRMKRLLPPVLVLLAVAFLVTPLLSAAAYGWLKADTPSALLYASNWWQIVAKQGYFDTTPHVLKHLWSLAVEEQFYFLWPPIAYLTLRHFGTRTTGAVAALLAICSTLWMGYLSADAPGLNDNRVYLGADTHAMGLLVGALLACWWDPYAPAATQPRHVAVRRIATTLALAALGYMVMTMNTAHMITYRGSFLLAPLLTCLVLYGSTSDRTLFISRLLRTRPCQAIGVRSYSMYLVHWPVFVWMRLAGWKDFADPAVLGAACAAVLVSTELLFRYVEAPVSRYNPPALGTMRKALAMTTYTVFAAVMFFVEIIASRPAPLPSMQAIVPAAAGALPVEAAPAPLSADAGISAGMPDATPDATEMIAGGEDIYAIGDSVLLGAKDHLTRTIPGIRVDAAVGRQASQGLDLVRRWHGKPGKASTVLVHLGTNGYINETQYRELLGALEHMHSVIVINVHAERRWTASNNAMIAKVAGEFPNVHVIDWQQLSVRRPEYFVSDGIHLTRRGILALTAAIKTATGGAVISEAEGRLAARAAQARPVQVALADKLPASMPLANKPSQSALADQSNAAPVASSAGENAAPPLPPAGQNPELD